MPNPVELSPGIDLWTDKVVVILQDRPVIGMSAWLVDALAAAETAGLGLQLVTPPETKLTFAVRTLLFTHADSRWVVNEPDGQGAYDGLGGSRLTWDGQRFTAVDTGEPDKVDMSPTFVDVDLDLPYQLWITARVRYQALESTVVGTAAQQIFEDLAGAVPAGWGTGEPVTQPWDVGRLTAFCRRRAPQPTWLAVVGGADGKTAVGSVEIHRRPAGLEEVVTVAVTDLPTSDEVREVADRLAKSHTLLSFFAQGARGSTDVNAIPHWVGVPAPMAMAVGHAAVLSEAQGGGIARALDVSDVGDVQPAKIGPTATPSVWYPIGDGRNQLDWNTYSALFKKLAGMASHQRPTTAPA